MNIANIAYIAGIVDGEGYIGIKKTSAYKCQERQTPGYHARIQIRMTHEGAIKFIANTLGGWYFKERRQEKNRKLLYCYQASDRAAEHILRKIIRFLKVKKRVAGAVLRLRQLQSNGKSYRKKITGYRNFPNSYGAIRRVPNLSFTDEYVEMCDELYCECKKLNS